jgi:hypothetical protein
VKALLLDIVCTVLAYVLFGVGMALLFYPRRNNS